MCGKNNGQMDFRSGFELSYILLCCTIGKDSFLSKKKKSYLQIVEINSLVSNGWIFLPIFHVEAIQNINGRSICTYHVQILVMNTAALTKSFLFIPILFNIFSEEKKKLYHEILHHIVHMAIIKQLAAIRIEASSVLGIHAENMVQ